MEAPDLWQLPVQQSPLGMAKVGLDGRLLAVNRTFEQMLGRCAEELIRGRLQDITHRDDVHKDTTSFRRALAGETDSYRVRKRYLHADGHVVWADVSVTLLHHPDGRPQHFVAQILDITEQQVREEQLEAIFDAVRVGLVLIGPDGRYVRMNRRHAQALDVAHPDGHHGRAGIPGQIFAADGRTPLETEELPTYRAMHGEEFDDLTTWVGTDEQHRRAFITSARTVRSPSGEHLGAALAYHEVTELMRAMKVKDDFVTSMSHELRTPLTSVLGYLEILADNDELPGTARSQVDVVRRNALRLQSLVSDLLEIAQFTESGLTLERAQVDVARVAREAAEAARPHAGRAGVGLTAELPPRVVAMVDEKRIRQVIDNLLSNAVKYSSCGDAVRVALSHCDRELELEVTDTGMGIPETDLPHVFDRFFRGSGANVQHIPGTGLGLDIAGTIVDAHGGTITVDSALGEGTTFRMRLPLAG
ncbi:sensor histidine kinase [Nocardioides caricicola]|uniref:histidine kinase n=1 Tax=Nocardioides caricicola TaxID=634770 RepID=A0ABW0N2Z7_9ACTN